MFVFFIFYVLFLVIRSIMEEPLQYFGSYVLP